MKLRITFGMLLLTVVIGSSKNSFAQYIACYEYYDSGPIACSDGMGCDSSYVVSQCGFGCVSGRCARGQQSGNQGMCCGTPYYNDQIYPQDGATCPECGGGGLTRVILGRPRLTIAKQATEGMNEQTSHYELTFVPDTCRGTYAVVLRRSSEYVGGF